MAKKIIIILGSPRKQGNCAALAIQVAAGAKEVGADVESIYVHGMDIQPCRGCDTCRDLDLDVGKDCVIDDGMQGLYPKLRCADAIVIASPIYWFTVSAQTKLFMDRCGGLSAKTNVIAGKPVGILLTYGADDPFDSGAINAMRTFQDIFRYLDSPIVGMVYGSAYEAGVIRDNLELMDKAYDLGKQLGSATQ